MNSAVPDAANYGERTKSSTFSKSALVSLMLLLDGRLGGLGLTAWSSEDRCIFRGAFTTEGMTSACDVFTDSIVVQCRSDSLYGHVL